MPISRRSLEQRKNLSSFLAHILVQKGAIKQREFNVPLYQTMDMNYFLAHTGAQSCCAPKCLAQSSEEIHSGHMVKVKLQILAPSTGIAEVVKSLSNL